VGAAGLDADTGPERITIGLAGVDGEVRAGEGSVDGAGVVGKLMQPDGAGVGAEACGADLEVERGLETQLSAEGVGGLVLDGSIEGARAGRGKALGLPAASEQAGERRAGNAPRLEVAVGGEIGEPLAAVDLGRGEGGGAGEVDQAGGFVAVLADLKVEVIAAGSRAWDAGETIGKGDCAGEGDSRIRPRSPGPKGR
jgi:hypothetical protein